MRETERVVLTRRRRSASRRSCPTNPHFVHDATLGNTFPDYVMRCTRACARGLSTWNRVREGNNPVAFLLIKLILVRVAVHVNQCRKRVEYCHGWPNTAAHESMRTLLETLCIQSGPSVWNIFCFFDKRFRISVRETRGGYRMYYNYRFCL